MGNQRNSKHAGKTVQSATGNMAEQNIKYTFSKEEKLNKKQRKN